MNSLPELMKIAFPNVGIVEIWIWVCQESYLNQPYPNMALLSSKLKKKCEYEYYSCLVSLNFFLGGLLRRIYMSNIPNLYV